MAFFSALFKNPESSLKIKPHQENLSFRHFYFHKYVIKIEKKKKLNMPGKKLETQFQQV